MIKQPFRAIFQTSLAILALASGIALAQQAQTLDKIVAVVDEGVILQSELNQRLSNVMQQFEGRSLPNGLTESMIREQVLNQLILESIQLQMAERNGLRMDDNTLNQTMDRIAAQSGMDFETFRQALESEGVYNQTREQIAREMIINQFQTRAVNGRINITRQEVENYLRSEAGEASIAPEYHVAHILVPGDNDNSPAARNRQVVAGTLYEEIQNGGDIISLAQSGRIDGVQVSGGDLGWRKPENLPGPFVGVVPTLQTGQVSEPFTSGSGIHLVQVLETRGGTELKIKQTHLRHILISPNEIRTEEQAEELIYELRDRIVNGEDFATIARQNTDDVNSIVSGGDLEWVSEGQLPPDYMEFIDTQPLNQLSEPFHSDAGWHIVEVLERRERDVTEENKRYRAEQILRERKYDMELENWLTELRDTTYVNVLGGNEEQPEPEPETATN